MANVKKHTAPLPSELIAQLGQLSDFLLASRFKVAPALVRAEREKRRIKPVSATFQRQSIDWTPEMDQLLGSMPDTAVARRLGTSKSIVGYRRASLNIARYERPPLPIGTEPVTAHQWTAAQEAQLGLDHDPVIAARMGVNVGVVVHRRYQLGIEPYQRSDRIQWSEEMLEGLGVVSDVQFANYYGISSSSARIKRIALGIPNCYGEPTLAPALPDKAYAMLGVKTDVEISQLLSVSRINVRLARMVLGIEPPPKVTKSLYDWDIKSEALLGTESDSNIALRLGIHPGQVRHRREKLGILPFAYSDKIRWSKDKVAQLGKYRDSVLAQRFRCKVETVTKKRESLNIEENSGSYVWSRAELDLLGTDSDNKIAKQLGVSSSAVTWKRKELGIAAFHKVKKVRWSKSRLALLGVMKDQDLAFKMQVSPSVVSSKRTELGIARAPDHRGVWTIKGNLELLGTMPDPQLAKRLGVTNPAIFHKRTSLGIPAFKPKK